MFAETVALLLPVVTGWCVMRKVWPAGSAVLQVSLGTAIGYGITGSIYFLVLVLLDSARVSVIASESVLVSILVATVASGLPDSRAGIRREPASRAYVWMFVLTALAGGAAFGFALDLFRHGGWDAVAIWNLKARFISVSSPLSAILDPAFLGLHPDYPLLLPSLVSRGWQYAWPGGIGPPMLIAVLFTATVVALTIGGVRSLSTNSQSWIAGALLLGTPFLLSHGASQYADIVLCCFMTAAVVLFSVFDAARLCTNAWLPFFAGIAAAAAACTKNEGILFFLVLVIARVVKSLFVRAGQTGGEFLRFAAGACLGVTALVVFKVLHAPPSEFFGALSPSGFPLSVLHSDRHLQIARGIRDGLSFGEWSINPLPLMAVHAAATPGRGRQEVWFTAAFTILGMVGGYYALYLVSPYDVEYHIQSSLNRLLLQLWPCIVLLYSMVAAPRDVVPSSVSRRTTVLRIAGALAIVLVVGLWPVIAREPRDADLSRPQIELSRTEVTVGQIYAVKISGVSGPQVFVTYSLDGRPMGQFAVFLGSDSTAEFPISASTPKGTYRFLAVRDADSGDWINFEQDAAITVK